MVGAHNTNGRDEKYTLNLRRKPEDETKMVKLSVD
jgi:hypothetical protein